MWKIFDFILFALCLFAMWLCRDNTNGLLYFGMLAIINSIYIVNSWRR